MARSTSGESSMAAWKLADAKRLRELEGENAHLKELFSEASLGIPALKAVFREPALQVKRAAIGKRIEQFDPSERHACGLERHAYGLVGRTSDSYRPPPVSDEASVSLRGQCIKCLTVADDFSHEGIDVATDFGISELYVTRLLDQVTLVQGCPRAIRTDNGPEFTRRAFMQSSPVGPSWPGRSPMASAIS